MFALASNRSTRSTEVTVAPGVTFTAESQAAVRASGSTSAGVLPATGGATDIFAGFVFAGTSAAPFAEPYANSVEQYVVPTGGVVTINFTPVSGQVQITDNTTGANVPITGGVSISGANISGLTVGDTVTVTYKYPLTVAQQQALYGNTQPGGYAGSAINQIGLIQAGQVYISEFDASKNWAAATSVTLAPNGQISDQTNTTSGHTTINAVVIALPSITYPYLGLEFAAAV